MGFHDPRQAAELIRNHLASHDAPISFLFGAGTSASINTAPSPAPGESQKYEPLIPAVDRLTKICQEEAAKEKKEFANAWDLLNAECGKLYLHPNIENILSRIRSKIEAIGNGDKPLGLDRDDLDGFEKIIRHTIATCVSPEESRIPRQIPHDLFARWIRYNSRIIPVEIFTTNYDILFERSLENSRIPIFDGFVGAYQPFFCPECLEKDGVMPGAGWVRLWKLHGSINWKIVQNESGIRVIRSSPSKDGEMILPSHKKYDESRKQPYTSLIDRLGRVLSKDGSLLVTCGYSFSDQHLNALIYSVLDNHPTSHVISLQYGELSENLTLTKAATQRPNLLVIGPNAAVIKGKWFKWRLSAPIDRKTHGFMDVFFDSFAEPDPDILPLNGQVRIGDFYWFCRFLSEIATEPKQGKTP